MYLKPDLDAELSQADIIDQCPVFLMREDETDLDANADRIRGRVIVVTQACDLAQAKSRRAVVAAVHKAQDLVDQGLIKASVVRDQVRRGLAYGLYFLPAATEPLELPESIVDLRDLHTVPRSILDSLIAKGNRVCSLATPWREHLAQHFGVTYMRIGLPEPYQTKP